MFQITVGTAAVSSLTSLIAFHLEPYLTNVAGRCKESNFIELSFAQPTCYRDCAVTYSENSRNRHRTMQHTVTISKLSAQKNNIFYVHFESSLWQLTFQCVEDPKRFIPLYSTDFDCKEMSVP